MIRYDNLFNLLKSRGMKKTDLLEVISSQTLAKLSKNDIIKSDTVDKICMYLEVQPNDIMEVYTIIDDNGKEREIVWNSETCELNFSAKELLTYVREDGTLDKEMMEKDIERLTGNKSV